MTPTVAYPVKVEARLDDHLSRWLWIVKWLLAIPHYIALAFLWVAFILMSVVAFFGILFTGNYPKSIFTFNVGVLRWSWRVAYYSYGALGTDKYPPFTLREEAEYPVHLEVEYPEHLSRGLVLIKWWLLAIPHYIIVGLLMGGTWMTVRGGQWETAGFGFIGILALVAGVMLLFTGRYPSGLFDLLLGLNRWVIRVAAYAGLMTDEYPPFRLDMGGNEPGASIALEEEVPATPPGATTARAGWGAGPVISVIAGSLIALISVALIAGGGVGLWADKTQREGGFVTSPTADFSSNAAHAIVTDSIDIHTDGPNWALPENILGDVRVRATGTTGPIFVGVARTEDVDRYLSGVSRSTIFELKDSDNINMTATPGGAPATAPADESFWIASSEGTGTRSVTWSIRNGNWSLVVMNADAEAGIAFEGDVGAEAPVLGAVATGLLIAGAILFMISVALIGGAIARAGRPVTAKEA